VRINELMVPPVAFGVKVISIGMFLPDQGAVAWRGPMLHRTVSQFLTDVYWGDLDYLLIDLPPGTGDVAISLGQLLPTGEHLVVTTPQGAAADVAGRSASVGIQTGQKVLGVIENMSWMIDSAGARTEPFGAGGGQTVAKALSALTGQDVPLLGQVPFDVGLRVGSDSGEPIVVSHPDAPAAVALRSIADAIEASREPLSGKRLPLNLS
jgi:ATP-binding protein involved in chromosome partitioning